MRLTYMLNVYLKPWFLAHENYYYLGFDVAFNTVQVISRRVA